MTSPPCPSVSLGKLDDLIHIVLGGHPVFSFMAALLTTEDYHKSLSPIFHSDRFHDAAAGCRPISRVDVDVLTKKTLGTMVRVYITFDSLPAILTDKVLDTS